MRDKNGGNGECKYGGKWQKQATWNEQSSVKRGLWEKNDEHNNKKKDNWTSVRIHEFFIIIEGKINGRRPRGRQRKSFFEEIFHWMGFISYSRLKRMTNMNSYYKAWLLEADDHLIIKIINCVEISLNKQLILWY